MHILYRKLRHALTFKAIAWIQNVTSKVFIVTVTLSIAFSKRTEIIAGKKTIFNFEQFDCQNLNM